MIALPFTQATTRLILHFNDKFKLRNDETMNEKPEDGTRIFVGDQWRRYWHRDYDVLIQEHN